MVNKHIWGLPADQSTQLTGRGIPVVCHRCCHRPYIMRPYCRKVWFSGVLVGEANGFSHPATEMSGEHLGFRSEVHKQFLLWVFISQLLRTNNVQPQGPYRKEQSLRISAEYVGDTSPWENKWSPWAHGDHSGHGSGAQWSRLSHS